MEQYLPTGESRTAYEEALMVWEPLMALESELEQISTALEESPTEELIHRQFDLQQRFQRLGGLTYQSRTRSTLLGLGFLENELGLPVSALSGGQRSKISLAKLLLADASLLLLDEPTNHLDIGAREALEQALLSYGGTLLVVSHDRYFINRLSTRILELSPEGVIPFEGDYDGYLASRVEAQPLQQKVRSPGRGGQDWAQRKERQAARRR